MKSLFSLIKVFIVFGGLAVCSALSIPSSWASDPKLVLDLSDPFIQAYRQAMVHYLSGDYPEAKTGFLQLADQYLDFASAQIYVADCLKALNQSYEAHKQYQKALDLLLAKLEARKALTPDVRDPQIYANIVYCLNALGDFQEAKKYGLIGAISGLSPDLLVGTAYAYSHLGDLKRARDNYCKAGKISDPKERNNLLFRRFSTLFQEGREWIDCPQVEKERRGTRYALIIAVGKYRDPRIKPLPYAAMDAQALYRILTDRRDNTAAFDPKNVILLINENATDKKVKFAIDDIVSRALGENDILLVFYAGHGFSYPQGSDTYWLTYDTVVGNDQGNRIKSTAFSNLTLAAKLADVKASTAIFFIDACFSAGMVTRPQSVRGMESYLVSGKDYVIISSSQANQESIAAPHLKHGIFTYHIIEGLSGKADSNRNGGVDVEELWRYVQTEVPKTATDLGHQQQPRRSGSSGGKPVYLKKRYY